MLTQSDIGKVVSFSLYPSAIIASGFTAVKIEAIISSAVARTYDDIDSLHAAVYPTLPDGTANSPNGYNYVLLATNAGQKVIGIPWIVESSITFSDGITGIFTVNAISVSDIQKIQRLLYTAGYMDVQTTVQGQ